MLLEGLRIKTHPFHWAAFATLAAEMPQVRMLVLREWRLERRTLIFHTDNRSPKLKQLKTNPNCSILFYSNQDQLQLRFQAKAHIHIGDALADFHFQQLQPYQQAIYKVDKAPSTVVSEIEELDYLAAAKDHFAAIVCNVDALEILYLEKQKHRRILFEWDKYSNINSLELVP